MNEYDMLSLRAANIFSPGAPVDKSDLFAGRLMQVHDVINAVFQRGQHVILYGERGVGKTSLTRVLNEIMSGLSQETLTFKHINCDVNDTFSSLWRKIFRELHFTYSTQGIGFKSLDHVESVSLDTLVGDEISPEDVRMLLSQFKQRLVIALDELDRIKDARTTVLLTDVIKTLSDNSVDVTLLLVGVADNVDQLIQGHQSIERSLVQVHMPRMSREELAEIISKAEKMLGMTMQHRAKQKILSLSEGLPHYTHLLGLYAFQNAAGNKTKNVGQQHVQYAVETAIKKAQRSIMHDYHRATSSARKDVIYDRVLLACALAQTDDLGYFAPTDIRSPLSNIMGKPYNIPAFARHLKDFCEENRGPVLQKSGVKRRMRYRFINPMLQPYVLMQGLNKGHINDDTLLLR
ncbi:AAA family ATPase [Alicyclobacillus acidoterrestris]|uniref:AAA family ATPase n=1 Tax=Alicyclobacillus acidoterrestris TaxID=1450 RepID=UPI003F530A77